MSDTVKLHTGTAELMGDGVVIVIQVDPDDGAVNNAVLMRPDLEMLLACC